MKTLGRLFVLLFLLSVFTGGALLYRVNQFLDQPMNLPPQGTNLTVKPGTSLRALTKDLEQKGVIESEFFLYAYARIANRGSRIRAGEYHIPAKTSPRVLLDLLQSGRPIQYSLTLIEGWNFRETMAAVNSHPALEHLLRGLSADQVMRKLGYEGQHPEGRFYPDTYQFERGMSDIDFLQRAYRNMEQRLEQAWKKREEKLPLKSAYEALILASIIEKETGVGSERPEIAGVFVRRLLKGMRLQTDPTVIYGMGESYQGNIRRKDLRTDTPYNTYMRKGLPPTPICMPGQASIDAALHPKKGDSLYFVAQGDGSHYFSSSLKEHNRAVRKYQLKK